MLSSTYFTPICIFPPQVSRFGHVYMYTCILCIIQNTLKYMYLCSYPHMQKLYTCDFLYKKKSKADNIGSPSILVHDMIC